MTCAEFIRLIDSYLCGEFSRDGDERCEAFEAHYFQCSACFGQLKIAERLHSREIPITAPVKPTALHPLFQWLFQVKWQPAAALAAVILAVVLSVLIIQQAGTREQLYRVSEFSPPAYIESETRGAARERSQPDAGIFDDAMSYYTRGQYAQALERLKQVPNPAENPRTIFFKGICHLQTGSPGEALEAFDVIIANMDPSYYDEAIYYKAIALLRLGQKDRALEQLNHLAGMFSPYAPRARTLIQAIK
jgi:tetratricopeptide (TPR) repeat protein